MVSYPISVPDNLMKTLSKYRAVTYKYDGMTLDDIAAKIAVNKGTISKWIFKFEIYGDVLVNSIFFV